MQSIVRSQTFSENELIERILAGEKSLYEVVVRSYNPCLYKTCRTYGYNHQDAEDLMQETYISAYASLSGFEYRSSLKTWLVRILLNHCYHKKEKLRTQIEHLHNHSLHQDTNTRYTMESNITGKELGHIIEQALSRIPEDYRLTFARRELNGMNVAETAELLNISEGNVKVRLNRAKGMLRKEIEKTYSSEDIYEFNLVYCDKIVDRVMAIVNA